MHSYQPVYCTDLTNWFIKSTLIKCNVDFMLFLWRLYGCGSRSETDKGSDRLARIFFSQQNWGVSNKDRDTEVTNPFRSPQGSREFQAGSKAWVERSEAETDQGWKDQNSGNTQRGKMQAGVWSSPYLVKFTIWQCSGSWNLKRSNGDEMPLSRLTLTLDHLLASPCVHSSRILRNWHTSQ